jgi:hypothetical protein
MQSSGRSRECSIIGLGSSEVLFILLALVFWKWGGVLVRARVLEDHQVVAVVDHTCVDSSEQALAASDTVELLGREWCWLRHTDRTCDCIRRVRQK